MAEKHPLSEREFWEIYRKVPRLTVEIIIRSDQGVLLTLRDIEPCIDMWHLPGGTVRFAEHLTDAVKRIAKRELSIDVLGTKLLGYIEYPSHYENGLDSPVGIAFEVTNYQGSVKQNKEAKKYGWFKDLPKEMHQEQKDFLAKTVFIDKPLN
jgi:ADP-ribose pyrophosphatase YjhB (NUDIX family)